MIVDSGVLKFPSISVLLSTSFLKFSKIFLMYLGAPMLGAYIFTMFMTSWWILPLSIMKCPSESHYMALFLKTILSEYCYPDIFPLSICLEYLFLDLHFQSL